MSASLIPNVSVLLRALNDSYNAAMGRREELVKALEQRDRELKEIIDAIKILENSQKVQSAVSEDVPPYDRGWSWSKKARWILEQHPEGLTTTEIADKIAYELEPGTKRGRVVNGISVAFAQQKKTFLRKAGDDEVIIYYVEKNKVGAG